MFGTRRDTMFPSLSRVFQPSPPVDPNEHVPESPIGDDDDFYGLGIGLSDEHISQKRQNMLNLADRLRSVGAQAEIDIPQIAVIGTQSSGKSSLLHAISGVRVARSNGTCTRVPTEILLKQAPGPWQCTVTLSRRRDLQGNLLGRPINEDFGSAMEHPNEVEERLKRAQLAILNPSQPPDVFLRGQSVEKSELSFSDNCVSVKIQGPKESNLSLCDLPGIIASISKKSGKESDIKMVEDLVESYIKKPNCLILLTTTCEADFETQGAYRMAIAHDPEGKRTLGVLTKPDRIPVGDEDRWIRLVQNEEEPLDLGWFCVKQPDSVELAKGISWEEARIKEKEFFGTAEPWRSLRYDTTSRLGIMPLVSRLSERLSDLIARRLPKLQYDVEEMLRTTENSLRELPAPPSEDSLAETMHLITRFSNDVERLISGLSSKDSPRLIQKINHTQSKMKREILSLAPRFNPYRSDSKHFRLPDIEFLEKEGGSARREGKPIYIHVDKVMSLIEEERTRELPGYIPFNVPATILAEAMQEWENLSTHFFDEVYVTIGESIKHLVEQYFQRFEYGGMFDVVRTEVQHLLDRLGDETKQDIKRILQREKTPFTLNGHYLARYKDDFLAYYKGCRQREVNSIAMQHIQEHARLSSSEAVSLSLMSNDAVTQVLAGLNTMNIRDVKASDLPKLLPRDPYEPALELMATASAYYQVSSKRFIDNVSLAVDYDFVRAFAENVQQALYVQIIRGDPREQCAKFLRESPEIRERRKELRARLDRLTAAKGEMMSYSIW
ncbi:hypothetical protein M0805_004719 [Coniferiporia weirii]|nr:hypothetical protein M0805_004719 [Coniferiporia weirii]